MQVALNTRVSIEVAQMLDEAASKTRSKASIVEEALKAYLGPDKWIGSGVWSGWRITTDHSSSSHNQPVLVNPRGQAYGPADID
jgi:hypothetical protein